MQQSCESYICIQIEQSNLCHYHFKQALKKNPEHKLAPSLLLNISVSESSQVIFQALSLNVLASKNTVEDKREPTKESHRHMTHPSETSNTTCNRNSRENYQQQIEDKVLDKVIEHKAATCKKQVLIPDLLSLLFPWLRAFGCPFSEICVKCINLFKWVTLLQVLWTRAQFILRVFTKIEEVLSLLLHSLLFLSVALFITRSNTFRFTIFILFSSRFLKDGLFFLRGFFLFFGFFLGFIFVLVLHNKLLSF